ncbi:MAG: Flp family type IVb pilin [Phascolarctobacterium sp.]
MRFILQWLKKNKRGAAITEYAVILAFVAFVGTTFVDGNMSGSINGIIKNVASLLGIETSGGNILLGSGGLKKQYINGNLSFDNENSIVDSETAWSDGNYRFSILGPDDNPIQLESNATYQVVVDLNKLPKELDPKMLNACLFLWGDTSQAATMNTLDMSFFNGTPNYQGYHFDFDQESNTLTYTFTTDDTNNKFGMNIGLYAWAVGDHPKAEQHKAAVEANYQNFLSLEKVNK